MILQKSLKESISSAINDFIKCLFFYIIKYYFIRLIAASRNYSSDLNPFMQKLFNLNRH